MEQKASSAEITRARQALSMAMQHTETAEQAAKEFRGECVFIDEPYKVNSIRQASKIFKVTDSGNEQEVGQVVCLREVVTHSYRLGE